MRVTARRKASSVAVTYSFGDQVFILSRAADRKLARFERSERTRRRRALKAGTSPQGYINEGSTGVIRSRPAPTLSLAITGQPHSMASFTTTPNASYCEGRTIKSAAA